MTHFYGWSCWMSLCRTVHMAVVLEFHSAKQCIDFLLFHFRESIWLKVRQSVQMAANNVTADMRTHCDVAFWEKFLEKRLSVGASFRVEATSRIHPFFYRFIRDAMCSYWTKNEWILEMPSTRKNAPTESLFSKKLISKPNITMRPHVCGHVVCSQI